MNLQLSKMPPPSYVAAVGKYIDAHGFRRADVGAADFDSATTSLALALVNRVGLIVYGDVGRGKTSFLKAIAGAKVINRRETHYISLKEPGKADHLDFGVYGSFCNMLLNRHVLIDDLGAEPTLNEYGERREKIVDFILRYLADGQGSLIIATNLIGQKLLDRYTARIDCLKERMLPVLLRGDNLRKWHEPTQDELNLKTELKKAFE